MLSLLTQGSKWINPCRWQPVPRPTIQNLAWKDWFYTSMLAFLKISIHSNTLHMVIRHEIANLIRLWFGWNAHQPMELGSRCRKAQSSPFGIFPSDFTVTLTCGVKSSLNKVLLHGLGHLHEFDPRLIPNCKLLFSFAVFEPDSWLCGNWTQLPSSRSWWLWMHWVLEWPMEAEPRACLMCSLPPQMISVCSWCKIKCDSPP